MISSTEPNFCLIVATLGRLNQLETLLESLDRQSYKHFRLIIIDQNDDDRLDHMIKKYSQRYPIKWIRVSFKGVSRARNVGLCEVRADDHIVAFPDDDCRYPQDLLERVRLHHIQGGFGVLAGVNVTLEEYGPCGDASVVPLTRYNVFKNGPTYVFFYSNEVACRVKNFDEALGPSENSPFLSGEDTDFSIRAIECKARNIRDRGMKISHPRFDVFGDRDMHKCLGYAIGRTRLLNKHRYPLWFVIANFTYPLLGVFKSIGNKKMLKYHLIQFAGRIPD